MDDRASRIRQLRVGVFVIVALLVAVGLIYLLGARARLFESRYAIYTEFTEVSGLVEGATVRLAGVQIGRVSDVQLPAQPGGKVRVELKIATQYADRIRRDSLALIETQGLLGDKVVEVTLGSAGQAAIKPGEVLASRDPADFGRALGRVSSVTDLAEQLRSSARTLNESKLIEDLAATASAARRIAAQMEKGQGLAHALLYEEPVALRKLDRVLASTQAVLDRAASGEGAVGVLTSKESAEAARRFVRAMDRFATAVNAAPGEGGLMPALLFDPQYRPVAEDLRAVARNLREVSDRLAGGRGALGSLLRDGPGDGDVGQITTDLRVAVANFRRLSERLNAGEGTLGALIVDPTLYENLSAVLEGTQRSFLLRSLIRGLGDKGRGGKSREADQKR